MDRGALRKIVNGRRGGRIAGLLLLALLLAAADCHRYERGVPPPAPSRAVPEGSAPDNAAPSAAPSWLPPAVAVEEPKKEAGAPPSGAPLPVVTEAGTEPPPPGTAASESLAPSGPVPTPPPEAKEASGIPPHQEAARSESRPADHRQKAAAAGQPVPGEPPKAARDASFPGWAKRPEELVYRVDFIGITMGYARFRYQGTVTIDGKPAYHLNVRAWTSGILSYIFPINETIDYYLDPETIAPIRQEFTQRESEKDDVALYDQETGKITYRYRQTGKIRKQVTTAPSVYDPVSVAYYFRWRDLGAENRPRNVYAGRKLYQISSRLLGRERIHTEHGDVDTIAVLPLIRRDGKPDDKGDLKIWFSDDERRIPVRLYAKFRKIKDWTLVGELIPPAGKAGG